MPQVYLRHHRSQLGGIMDVSATKADGQPVGQTLLKPIGRTNLGWLLDTEAGRHFGGDVLIDKGGLRLPVLVNLKHARGPTPMRDALLDEAAADSPVGPVEFQADGPQQPVAQRADGAERYRCEGPLLIRHPVQGQLGAGQLT